MINSTNKAKPTLSQIWDLLVKHAGAWEEGRREFMAKSSDYYASNRPTEYCFMGALGFGGKVWLNHGPHPYVSCNGADETEGRRKLMDIANEELKLLSAQVTCCTQEIIFEEAVGNGVRVAVGETPLPGTSSYDVFVCDDDGFVTLFRGERRDCVTRAQFLLSFFLKSQKTNPVKS